MPRGYGTQYMLTFFCLIALSYTPLTGGVSPQRLSVGLCLFPIQVDYELEVIAHASLGFGILSA